ncbi:MAG: efflux RND transporter periplasmic adaptor subunit [Thiogranum sp.]
MDKQQHISRASGRSHRARCRIATLLTLAALLGGCEKPEVPHPPMPEVTVLSVEPRDTPVTFEFVGSTASSQQVEVRARVNGFLDHRLYTEGAMVKQGQVMFQMDRKPFEAQLNAAKGALDEQKARLWTAQANLNRVKPLAKANAVSKKDLDDAQGQVNAAAAAVEMAKADVETAKLNLGYTTINAPVTGASSFARIQDGAYVNEQSGALTYVAQLDPIWVDFSISEDQMLRIRRQRKSGQLQAPEATGLTVELVLSDGSVYPETGKIFFGDANYSTETGTFLVRATFSNPLADLRPGQFVRVRVKGGIRPDAVLVPQRAVLQGAKGFFVWIVDNAGKAQVRNVEVGDWQGDNWFISKGLSGGDKVITDGIVRLAMGTPVKIVDKGAGERPGESGDAGVKPASVAPGKPKTASD